jgi:hypothetical protein
MMDGIDVPMSARCRETYRRWVHRRLNGDPNRTSLHPFALLVSDLDASIAFTRYATACRSSWRRRQLARRWVSDRTRRS